LEGLWKDSGYHSEKKMAAMGARPKKSKIHPEREQAPGVGREERNRIYYNETSELPRGVKAQKE